RPRQGRRGRPRRRRLRHHGAHRRRRGGGHRQRDRTRGRLRRGRRRHDLPRGDEDPRRLPPLQGRGEGADPRQPDRVRQHPVLHHRRAARRRRGHRALLLRRLPRDEQGRARLLRDRAPRRHPEEHHRPAADPRRAVRLPRLPRLRRQARRTVQEGSEMTEATEQARPKPKKSVALSGTPAGNTALCTVGRSGNDLHYRGYDIHDLATQSSFEEVAHLLVHGALPTASQLKAYKAKLKRLRGLPAIVSEALELVPANAHPMDVLRTGCSVLGTVLPEREGHPAAEARDIADRLMASFGSMLLYWWHFTRNGRRIDCETDDDSIAAHFLHLLHGEPPSQLHADSLDKSLVL